MPRREPLRLQHEAATLFALDQGEGPALLFFHGGLADHRAALLQVGGLTERLRVITPDLRGAGQSHHGGALSWGQLADDARAWLDHLGLERVTVGGVSMGSGVALRVALDHPERVSALALVHPVYPGEGRALDPASEAAMQALHALGRRAPEEGVEVLLPLFEALPEDIRARARAMVLGFDPASVAATTRFLAEGPQPFQPEALRALRCPTLVVPGLDPSHPAALARDLAAELPRARLLEAEGEALSEALARLAEGGEAAL
ncbi:MAG: alpha/beta fold hydrolase [Alphaproteobacteria bacterium]|nr:alpha/beta fold hydrolase [Alphaproteobacteria bacterium]